MNTYECFPVYDNPCEPNVERFKAANFEEATKIARREYPTATSLRRITTDSGYKIGNSRQL